MYGIQTIPISRKKLNLIDEDFDLVMISNYYFESLVLLKQTLCMDWSDLYAPPTKVKHYDRAKFTDADKEIFHNFFKQDIAIFNRFNQTFWKKVEAYGYEKMTKDVAFLKKMYDRCNADKWLPGCESGHAGHEMVQSFKDRERLPMGGVKSVLKYMKDNGGDCAWGKFPELWKKHYGDTL